MRRLKLRRIWSLLRYMVGLPARADDLHYWFDA
jgi:hypothetical protein